MDKSTWVDIKGYEGVYQINRDGVVKRIYRNSNNRNLTKEKILKPILKKNGYVQFGLSYKNKVVAKLHHRLLAEAFIPNPENKPTVNHKNGIHSDNRIENLEWATQKEQIQHAWAIGLSRYTYERTLINAKLVLCLQTGIFYYKTEEAAHAKCITKRSMRKMLNGETKNKTLCIYA